MVKHKSTAIDCPVILKSACFQGVSETTLSALRRRISELDTALGCEVLNPYVYWVIAGTSSKIEYLSADLVKLLLQESAPMRKSWDVIYDCSGNRGTLDFSFKNLSRLKKRAILQALASRLPSHSSSNPTKSVRIHQKKLIPTYPSKALINGAKNTMPPVILPTMDGEVCFDHIHFS